MLAEIVGRPAAQAVEGWLIASADGPDLEILERPAGLSPAADCGISLATSLTVAEVFALAGREGWPARYRRPQGTSGVIDLLLERDTRLEVLTPEMQSV
ncbi:hypothetical protein L284_16265 [Novosphingobium lindaniclasticum LE124]|uniref:Uncharacterized protein n=1 Tax=Novosphingobium lindaniclasticum LE124 TaxID=1096930 RepID=T0IJZ3_9SPHN|nr:hypothetical protein L284_16265 [Novosphingobium lindaniclasticum LE124]